MADPDNILYTAPKLDQLGGGKMHDLGVVYDHLPTKAEAAAMASADELCPFISDDDAYPPYGKISGAADSIGLNEFWGGAWNTCTRVIIWPEITHDGSVYDAAALADYRVMRSATKWPAVGPFAPTPKLFPLVQLPGGFDLVFGSGTIEQVARSLPSLPKGELPINETLGEHDDGFAMNVYSGYLPGGFDEWIMSTAEWPGILSAMLAVDHARAGVPHAMGLVLHVKRARIKCIIRQVLDPGPPVIKAPSNKVVGAKEDSRVYAHAFFLESLRPLFTAL